MKKVPCAYKECGKRRVHWERPDEERGQQMVEVPDDFPGPLLKKAYCSITCAVMDGSMSLTTSKPNDIKDKENQNGNSSE